MAIGCTSQRVEYRDTIVRDTVLTIQPPTIHAELTATTVNDSVIVANKMHGRDTVISVRYRPINKTFYITAKPDSVRVTVRDTVTQYTTQTVVQETPFVSKVGIAAIGGTIACALTLALLIWIRRL